MPRTSEVERKTKDKGETHAYNKKKKKRIGVLNLVVRVIVVKSDVYGTFFTATYGLPATDERRLLAAPAELAPHACASGALF